MNGRKRILSNYDKRCYNLNKSLTKSVQSNNVKRTSNCKAMRQPSNQSYLTLMDLPLFLRQRREYTKNEDLAILNYLINNGLYSKVNLRSTWHQLATAKVTAHSADSMRNRLRTVLVPRLSEILPNCPQHIKEAFCQGVSSKRRSNQRIKLNFRTPETHTSSSATALFPRIESSSLSQLELSPVECINVTNRESDEFEAGSSRTPGFTSTPAQSPRKIVNHPPLSTSNEVTSRVEENVNTEIPLIVGNLNGVQSNMPEYSSLTQLLEVCQRLPLKPANELIRITSIHSAIHELERLLIAFPWLETLRRVALIVDATNGRLTDALSCLLSGQRQCYPSNNLSPPLWTPADDLLLSPQNSSRFIELMDKFGIEDVLQRIIYLADR